MRAKTNNGAETALFWFRRDLRAEDNAGLSVALARYARVFCVFVFDTDILQALPHRADRRVEFIWESVAELKTALEWQGGGLIVLHGAARRCVPELATALGVAAVHTNRDYEPAALARDEAVATALLGLGISFHTSQDQVIFEGRDLLTLAGRPYTVFTPYRNAWLRALTPERMRNWPAQYSRLAADPEQRPMLPLGALGFERTDLSLLGIEPGMSGAQRTLAGFLPRMARYHELRDFPDRPGGSGLSIHLRFGTLSIRHLVRLAQAENDPGAHVWLNELIWREFYFSILSNFPHVVGHAFKPEYERLTFDDNPEFFDAWQKGLTGYPIVDAAMRQLRQTGFMHNRLRMIAASFLVKDLGVDWRLGEAYFAEQLNDFDLAANNGGWQWTASTGCDAQPWFRIFNPVTQAQRFDPEGRFIRRFLPQLADVPARRIHAPWQMTLLEQQAAGCIIGRDYPVPIVDHALAREKTLKRYQR